MEMSISIEHLGNIEGDTETGVFDPIINIKDFNLWYGNKQALNNINMIIPKNKVTAFIGPSGCGKSTLLRSINRMNDLIDIVRVQGSISLDGKDIYKATTDVTALRRNIGMVFQKSNPFPKTIYENIAYGPRIHGMRSGAELDAVVEKSLKGGALWEEVSDRLQDNALGLSGGQQQRLCIARAIAVSPGVLLMDEPCSALDPIATGKIEDLIQDLKKDYTIVIVTHNMQQAARVSDYTGFMLTGDLVEFGKTKHLFQRPKDKRTQDYITGRFG